MSKDWQKWHTHYDDEESGLAKRLVLVQKAIHDSIPDEPTDKFQIIDICSGDGRDLIEVLANHPHNSRIYSYLVEINEALAAESLERANNNHLTNVEVARDDASKIKIYKDFIPADLILLCGIFGNINNSDIAIIIKSLAQLAKKGSKVIWTRSLREPEIFDMIRASFISNEFEEIRIDITSDDTYAVGLYEFTGQTEKLDESLSMFTFIK